MARPPAYRLADGTRVPSVTTVIKHVESDAEPLLRWAWRLGSEGVSLDDGRQKAFGIGTCAHAAIEADLRGETVDLSKIEPAWREGVEASLRAWRLWRESVGGVEVLGSEVPLVSEQHRVGGTCDAVLRVQGQRTLFDFKTGNALYPKDMLQIAAYGMLWDELHPSEPIERYALLRLAKDDGAFTWRQLSSLSMDGPREAFVHCRALYDLARAIKDSLG